MTVAEQRIIDAAKAIARRKSPDIAGFLYGRGFREDGHLVSDLVRAVEELDGPTPPPPGSGVLDEIQRAAGAYGKLFNNWCVIWHRDVIADARFIPLLDEAVRERKPLTRDRIDAALGKVAWDA